MSLNFYQQKQFAITLVGYISLLIWSVGYKISCMSLIIPLIIGILLFQNTYIFSIEKKLCISNCYFNKDTFFYRLFNKKFLSIVASIISSIILTLSLSIAIIRFDILDFIIFGVDLLLLVYLYNNFKKNNILNENFKYSILKNTVSWINSIIISILFVFIGFFKTPPSYISNDFNTTIEKASNQTASTCIYIDYLSRISAEIAATKWWMILNVTQKGNNEYFNKLLWILFLIGNYLSIFAFSRFITELIYIFTKKFDKEDI